MQRWLLLTILKASATDSREDMSSHRISNFCFFGSSCRDGTGAITENHLFRHKQRKRIADHRTQLGPVWFAGQEGITASQ